mgnify:CR=1 FL=1
MFTPQTEPSQTLSLAHQSSPRDSQTIPAKSKQVLVADERMYASTRGDRRKRNELKNRERIQEIAIDNVNSGSSEQPEFIEPAAQVAGTVDSQDMSGLVM